MKPNIVATLLVVMAVAFSQAAADGPPPLPEGLGEAPVLPAGLGDEPPALPAGLGDDGPPALPEGMDGAADSAAAAEDAPGRSLSEMLSLSGFWEMRAGTRTQSDRYEKDASIGETRLQLERQWHLDGLSVKVVSDFLYDAVPSHHTKDLEDGEGWVDLREASVAWRPSSFMDVKAGRQILTWGTGDLLFLNDLFPKDWVAFFIGREVAYLKAPSDALKVGLFLDVFNVDLVYSPSFDADRYITGERISFENPMLASRSGQNAVIRVSQPADYFSDDEFAVRLYKTAGAWELAAYGYDGFWKSPAGMNASSGKFTFPPLSVYGASVRGPLGSGISNVEAAYYDSRSDRSGANPFVRNSEFRVLTGYEQDLKAIARDLTVGVQYYLEWMMDHDAYERGLPPGVKAGDEFRYLVTTRVTKLLLSQNLKLSFFVFYSPSDEDAYLRPAASYKLDDHWTAYAGGNVFLGTDGHTFFGQFEDNTNAYLGIRYGF